MDPSLLGLYYRWVHPYSDSITDGAIPTRILLKVDPPLIGFSIRSGSSSDRILLEVDPSLIGFY